MIYVSLSPNIGYKNKHVIAICEEHVTFSCQ